MNLFALLAVALGVTSVILFSALMALADSHRRWRELAEELWDGGNKMVRHCDALASRNDDHSAHAVELTAAASALRDECRLLELRNAYLESMFTNFKGVLAGARLAAPSTLDTGQRFAVRASGEAP